MEKQQVVKIVAANLRELMNNAGFSSTDLARKSKISTGTISKILKGNMNLSLSMAISLAEGLGVDLSSVLKGLILPAEQIPLQTKSETTKNEPLSIGIMSINNRRMTCILDHTGVIIGTSELEGGLDLAETSSSLLNLIQESITAALANKTSTIEKINRKLKQSRIHLVTQSYEFEDTRLRFANFAQKYFKSILLLSDWQISYLSTFTKENGISLITDKGISLSYMKDSELKKLGGWKFPVYDLGGENWLGVETIRHTIEAVEGYIPMSNLAQTVMAKFGGKIERITETCFKGTKDHDIYCIFAEVLIRAYLTNDEVAKKIIGRGFTAIYRLIEKVDEVLGKKVKIALNGSLVDIYKPFFDPVRLIPPSDTAQKVQFLASVSESYLTEHGIKVN